MKVALAQIRTVVGDLEGNARRVVEAATRAREAGASLVVFPELTITGYPPLDLLLDPAFVRENRRVLLEEVAPAVRGIAAAVGFVDEDPARRTPEGAPALYDAAAVLEAGRLVGIARKTLLPEYDVFFERRYFASSPERVVHPVAGTIVGVEICEDMWDDAYECKVSRHLAASGARLLVNLSASPFHAGKRRSRFAVGAARAKEAGIPLFYCNAVGSEDGYDGQLVFDGGSFGVDREGRLVAAAKSFEDEILVVDLREDAPEIKADLMRREEEILRALVVGIREYAARSGFRSAVLGLSGGIDSAVTACLAAEVFGPERVVALSMPSRFSTERGRSDAASVARALRIDLRPVPIEEPFEAVERLLGSEFAGEAGELARENVQARLRGLVLMAYSNRFGHLLLSTGNKTELALGYCTLYGDMAGGLAPINDLNKADVYALGRYFNERAGRAIVPESVFEAAPSPELKPDHVEPFDYDLVSPIVQEIVENRASLEDLLGSGHPREIVEDCLRRIRGAEYKRRQAPPGIKVSGKAFGLGRRIPISHGWPGPRASSRTPKLP